MNRLLGTITAIECNDHLSLVEVAAGPAVFTALLLETPARAPYLKTGNRVAVLFKETEVSLAKNLSGQISLRNRLPCRVRQVRSGDILSEVALEWQGHALASIITTRAAQRLALQAGDEVEALVKANEVTLAEAAPEAADTSGENKLEP